LVIAQSESKTASSRGTALGLHVTGGHLSFFVAPAVAAFGTGGGPEKNLFPRVLGTARLISLMELAAAQAMEPILGAGELSAATGVRIMALPFTPEKVYRALHAAKEKAAA